DSSDLIARKVLLSFSTAWMSFSDFSSTGSAMNRFLRVTVSGLLPEIFAASDAKGPDLARCFFPLPFDPGRLRQTQSRICGLAPPSASGIPAGLQTDKWFSFRLPSG